MSQSPLHTFLEQAICILAAFNQTLLNENAVLLAPHNDADLYAFTQEKHTFLAQLEAQHQACSLALHAMGLEHTYDDLQRAAQMDATLAASIEQFFALAETVRQQNLQNGIILQTYLEHHQQALNALTTVMQRSEQVYTAQGKTRSHKLQHTPITA